MLTLTVGAKSCIGVTVVAMWLAFRKPTVKKHRHLLTRLQLVSQELASDLTSVCVNLPAVNNVSRKTMGGWNWVWGAPLGIALSLEKDRTG